MFVLVLLLTVAFVIQYKLDARRIVQAAAERGWAPQRIVWAPLARWSSLSRTVRSYWLSFHDDDGRPARCLCLVGGPYGVHLEEREEPGQPLTRHAPASRLRTLLLCAGGGVFAGVALGIGACFLLYPGSNIAPAYGVILGAPLGLAAGVVLGLVRGRWSGARRRTAQNIEYRKGERIGYAAPSARIAPTITRITSKTK